MNIIFSQPQGERGGFRVTVANAIYDAIGVQITDLPITAEKIYRALQESRVGNRSAKSPSFPLGL